MAENNEWREIGEDIFRGQTCQDFQQLIELELGGRSAEIEPMQWARMIVHVLFCDECQAKFVEISRRWERIEAMFKKGLNPHRDEER